MAVHARDLSADLVALLEARFPRDDSGVPYADWIEANTTMRRKPFSLKGFEFQRTIANDLHPDLWVIKLSQIGLTEIQIRKYLAILKRMPGTTGIMTFPTDTMRDRNSQTRIKPLVEGEAVFGSVGFDKPVRHKGLYQIDTSYGYVTGSTVSDATSIPASFLMHDELDLTDQEMVSLFRSRLQGARDFSMVQRYSTPTYLGFGIDKGYAASDRHEYQVRCGCGHWQIPLFTSAFVRFPSASIKVPDDLTEATDAQIAKLEPWDALVVCEECDRPLPLDDPDRREWVAEFPSRRSRGYRVRPFSLGRIGPAHTANTVDYVFDELVRRRGADDMKGFRNTVMGEAHNDANARITIEDIESCAKGEAESAPPNGSSVFVGIDIGATCHVVVGDSTRAWGWHQVPRSELVEFVTNLGRRYRIVQGAIDRQPETEMAERVRDIPGLAGIVMPTQYATTATAMPVAPGKNEFGEVTHYVVNRTQALDAVQKRIREHAIAFMGYERVSKTTLITHLRNMVRVEDPEAPPRWQKLDGSSTQDHFFHALSYMLLAVRIRRGIDFVDVAYPDSPVFIMGAHVLKPREASRGR